MERLHLLRHPSDLDAPAPVGLPALRLDSAKSTDVAIVESGEPLELLVDDIEALPVYALEGWPGASEQLVVRKGVNALLRSAQQRLPRGFGLVVLDSWRSVQLQRALYEHYYDSSPGPQLKAGFVSAPGDPKRPPPHCTGGAVDLTLSWHGVPMLLGTDFDEFSEKASLVALEHGGAEEPDRSLRRLLTHVLLGVGFAPYAQEWWHFSYGDQAWAVHKGLGNAIYGQVEGAGFAERLG